MKAAAILLTIPLLILLTEACGPDEESGRMDKTYLGTVEKLCTHPKSSKQSKKPTCALPLRTNCDTCALRLYTPETTQTDFLVQPLDAESLAESPYVLATRCRCSEGCFFHRSSVAAIGQEHAPKAADGSSHAFSEPFVCFSGISAPQTETQAHTYLVWCERAGGCPHDVVAKYLYLVRHDLLAARNGPTGRGGEMLGLPTSLCKKENFETKVKAFLSKPKPTPTPSPSATPSPTPKPKVVKDPRKKDGKPFKVDIAACKRSSRVERCVQRCLSV